MQLTRRNSRPSTCSKCRRLAGTLAAVFTLTLPVSSAAAVGVNGVAFVDNFEAGLRQWDNPGSAVVTASTAAQGRQAVTFTETACGGDAFSRLIPVTSGMTYRIHTAYRTDGGGGYIGVSLYDATRTEVGEQWLIGDGGYPTYADVRWRYNVDEQRPQDLHHWATYSADYPIPAGVTYVAIKIEDWGCGGLPDDPLHLGVSFDAIRWTPIG